MVFEFFTIVEITFKGFRIFIVIKLVKTSFSSIKVFPIGLLICLGLDYEVPCGGVSLEIKSDSPFFFLLLCLHS